MANPQRENGHIEIANDLWDAIMSGGFTRNEYRALMCILRFSYGCNKKYANLKKKEISDITRIPLQKVNETLTSLEKKNVIRISKDNGYIYFHKDYDKWKLHEKLTFDEKWRAKLHETLTKNLTKSEVKLHETLTSTEPEPPSEANRSSPKYNKNNIKNIDINNIQIGEKFDKLLEVFPDVEFCKISKGGQKVILDNLVKLHFKKFPWSKSVHKKIRGAKGYTAFVVRTRQYFEGIFQKFPTLAPIKVAKAIIEAESDKPWVYYPEERAKKERYLTDEEIQKRIGERR